MIRMSRSFEKRWRDAKMEETLSGIVLEPRLRNVVQAPFLREGGCLLLEPLVSNATSRDAFQDRTGYEAFIKIHIDDFLDDVEGSIEDRVRVLVRQGGKAAIELGKRLNLEGSYRVLGNFDADLPTMSLRFFERRSGEAWGGDDPDAFSLEEVLMIDTER
jgi:hypothetical protein